MIKAKATTRDRLIVALDTSSLDEAQRLVEELKDEVTYFKVGLELFCHAGVNLFDFVKSHGLKIFFDGKFLDIPNTVAGAARNITSHGVNMFNIHATGGLEMMKAAAEATRLEAKRLEIEKPLLIAVTVVTSLDDQSLKSELSVNKPVAEHVVDLALLAREAGLDGVVASAMEARSIREAVGEDFVIVTPGIRPSWSENNDQKRIVTPCQALKDGSDYLVVGRPITTANNRKEAARRIIDEMEQAIA
ncbi:MAG: orotidine-5'-phosphate decarboxylase [Candidatus Obscuribacterales bacterium]|nr:orotidine-5'-phosphate decarboxylase [Candidatus Obscuribacterales bacterium]